MEATRDKDRIRIALHREEALVLGELLQRVVEDDNTMLLPLLHSSAEFAVLCRMNNHLEQCLPEMAADYYDDEVRRARQSIIKHTGKFEGIEER